MAGWSECQPDQPCGDTLLTARLINFDAMIADYNITHSKESSGKGVNLDINYLYSLGPQALPAPEAVEIVNIKVHALARGFLAVGLCIIRNNVSMDPPA